MRKTIGFAIASACFLVIIPTVVTMMFPNLDQQTGWAVITISVLIGLAGLATGLWRSRRDVAAGLYRTYTAPAKRRTMHEQMITYAGYLWALGSIIMVLAAIVFVAALAVDYFGNRAMAADPTFVAAPPRIMQSHILSDGRTIVGFNPRYLKKLYTENTTLKADAETKDYIGNWIELSGPFGDVQSPRKQYNQEKAEIEEVITITFDDQAIHNSPYLSLNFDAKKWKDYTISLEKGQIIYVRCKIADISFGKLRLSHCEIYDPKTGEVVSNVTG